MGSRPWWALPALAAGLLCASPASAATYTVATTGSDSSNGITAPFRTFLKGVRALRSGDTLIVNAGTYGGGAYLAVPNVTIRGSGTAIIDAASSTTGCGIKIDSTSGVRLENLTFRNAARFGVFCVLSRNVTFRNLTCDHNGASGILTANTPGVVAVGCICYANTQHGIYYSQSGDNLAVRSCRLYNNGRAGLQINATEDAPVSADPNRDGLSKSCMVEKNVIYGNGSVGGSAINLAGVCDSTLRNNLIYNNLAGGIALWDDLDGAAYGCKRNDVLHNTIAFASGKGRYALQLISGSTGNTVCDNILGCGAGPAIETSVPLESNYNCFWAPTAVNGASLASWRNSSGNDQNSFSANPGFVSGYHLATSSPAVDAGLQTCATDRINRARPEGAGPDLGCYEEPAAGSLGTASTSGVYFDWDAGRRVRGKVPARLLAVAPAKVTNEQITSEPPGQLSQSTPQREHPGHALSDQRRAASRPRQGIRCVHSDPGRAGEAAPARLQALDRLRSAAATSLQPAGRTSGRRRSRSGRACA
jgi:hypothetical protein